MATAIDKNIDDNIDESRPTGGLASRGRPARDPLDTTIRLVTPERIRFQYPLAGPFRRATAYLLDLLFWLLILLACVLALAILSIATFGLAADFGNGLLLVVYFILQWGYGAFCEAVFNGRTLGKRLVGIRVVSTDGVPITAAQAVLRNLLWTFEWALPFGYLPAIISMTLTRRFQRLGDLAAKTMVVVEIRERQQIHAAIRDPAVQMIMDRLPARVVAGPELSRALGHYVKRRRRDSRERREEMAGHLAGALKVRYSLPPKASNDAVLCAFYNRVFWGDRAHGADNRRSTERA